MRIFQSLWTKPAIDRRWDTSGQLEANIWLYALSAVYAKKQGVKLILHTDTLGAKLLGHLPYDEIHTSLNSIPQNIPSMIWAYGKFIALKNEPLNSIHIDGDVFLKSEKAIEQLAFDGNDLIVQNKEHASSGIYTDTERKLDSFRIVKTAYFDTDFAYNCGVVGFSNKILKEKYLTDYLKHTNLIAQNKSMRDYMNKNKYFCVDLPLEQHSLSVVAAPYKVKCLLEINGNEWWCDDTRSKAASIGYQHLIGKEKYDYIDRVKFTLLAIDKDIYYKTKNIIQKYKNTLI